MFRLKKWRRWDSAAFMWNRVCNAQRTIAMTQQEKNDIIVYLCKNCLPQGGRLSVQWTDKGKHIRIKEIPCSGKIDAQYILHALEGGVRGIVHHHLSVGQMHAHVRAITGPKSGSERYSGCFRRSGSIRSAPSLYSCSEGESVDGLKGLINNAAGRFSDPAAAAHQAI